MCLTGACEENDFPTWARPATCAAIAVTALVFFSLMYFGKSCSEARETWNCPMVLRTSFKNTPCTL